MVRAVFKFKGTNNDEVLYFGELIRFPHSDSLQLKFKKGDLITITQSEDGGWWEGTLDGKTGWFPSNYVEKVDAKENKIKEPGSGVMTEEVLAKNVDYRQQVISDMLEKEQEFVSELRVLHDQYLQPLHHADM